MSRYVSELKEIPQTECWVILKNTSTYHEADERSKKNPGHGYPTHTDHAVSVYEVFDNEADFINELGRMVRGTMNSGEYRGFKVQSYTTKLVVESQILAP